MKIELPDEFATHLEQRDLLVDLAVGMYAARHATLGQAAAVANLSQGELQRELGRRQISVHYDLEDLAFDLRAAEQIARS
jgi:predicted HTH domain antitoxin